MQAVAPNITDIHSVSSSPLKLAPAASAARNAAESGSLPKEASADQSGTQYSNNQINEAIKVMNKQMQQQVSREIQFSVDKNSNRVVIKVVDQQTGKLIKQIPPEAVLQMSEDLDKLQGLLVQEKA